jgi:hypothetical protein
VASELLLQNCPVQFLLNFFAEEHGHFTGPASLVLVFPELVIYAVRPPELA